MKRSIKSAQRKMRVIALHVDGVGTANLKGPDALQASITDNGVGDFTITFDEAFDSAAEAVIACATVTSAAGVIAQVSAKTASSVRVLTFSESTSAGTATAAVKASGVLNMPTDDITVTAAAFGDEANGRIVTLQVAAAAANAGDDVLVDVTGTERSITITITPDNGGQNITVTDLVSLLNGGVVANSVLTDVSNLLSLVDFAGTGVTDVFADAGVGDGVTVTLAAGADASSSAAGVARAAADCEFDLIVVGTECVDRF